MAASGYTPISLYYSTTPSAAPGGTDLVYGELAINIADGKLYFKNSSNVVTLLASSSTAALTIPVTVPNGGTGLTSVSAGRILYGNGTSALNTSSSLQFLSGVLQVGPGSALGGTTNPFLAVTGNDNNYIQQYIYNANTGASASSDFVAYADNSADAHGWMDMGFTSSIYNDAIYSITGANEGYLLASAPSGAGASGDMVFGTDSTGTTNAYRWYVGGFNQLSTAWKMKLTSTGLQLANALGVAYGGTGQTSYTDGQLLIGNSSGNTLTKATLTAGAGVSITNGNGSITIAATGSGGTVTSVSVASANGFAGTVANATTTPAITISTSVTGLLKGNGTAVSAAVSGTDYAPATSGTSILYGNGAGGFSSVTIGSGLSFATGTLSNSGVTGLSAGTGISLSGSTGSVTVTNSAPDQVVSIASGTGISVTGTYPSFTVTNSSPMTYPGAGIAVSTGSAWTTSLTAPSGALVGTTDTQTLTNKRVTLRIGTTTSAATITPTSDLSDQYNVTALGTTAAFAAPSGTPTDGQKLTIRIKDSGVGQTMSWTTSSGGYRVIGTTLPTSIAAGKTIYVGCIWNAADSFWDVVSVATQA